MSRRTRRRRRKTEPPTANEPAVEKPVNWSRLRQVFGNLTARGIAKPIFYGFVHAPVVVEASSPEEAEEKTNEAFIAATKKQMPS